MVDTYSVTDRDRLVDIRYATKQAFREPDDLMLFLDRIEKLLDKDGFLPRAQ